MHDLHAHLDTLGHPKILVVGDLILDRYTWGNADRVSPEAPVLVLKADAGEVRLGGAASVAFLLRALECQAHVAGVTGDDADGRTLLALLAEAGIDHAGVFTDPGRVTTVKERFIGRAAQRHPHQILRVDHEQTHSLDEAVALRLTEHVLGTLDDFDVVLVSDYGKGVCLPWLLGRLLETARRQRLPVLVDPARGVDFSRYADAALLVPNRIEAEAATGTIIRSPDDALEAARRLRDQVRGLRTVIVKLDRDGMVLLQGGGPGRHFPTQPREVADVTGAGDLVLAMLGLCRAAGLFWADAVALANVAAGLEVEKLGIAPVTRPAIRQELDRMAHRPGSAKRTTSEAMAALAAQYRHDGKTVVFTNGCLDLLHLGHVTYLLEAAAMGDVLVVAINSDDSVRRLKGAGRPLMSEEKRGQVSFSRLALPFLGLPRARNDDSSPNVLAVTSCHTTSPYGAPRTTDRRRASSSASV